MKTFKYFILSCLIFFCLSPAYSQSREELIFSTSPDATEIIEAYFKFLQIVYDEMGHDLVMVKYPARRTFTNLDRGHTDGIVLTTPHVTKKYKNILLVPPPLATINVVAYTYNKEIEVDGLKSLAPYKIGIMRGYELIEKLTNKMDRHLVNNYNSLFSVLKTGRVDVGLGIQKEGLRFLAKNPQFQGIRVMQPPIYFGPLYHLLHKRHQAMIPQLSAIIDHLIKEEILERLLDPYRI